MNRSLSAVLGVLERLISTNASMTQLLLGKWLFFGVTGLAQVVLMFVWGALVFGLDLWGSAIEGADTTGSASGAPDHTSGRGWDRRR